MELFSLALSPKGAVINQKEASMIYSDKMNMRVLIVEAQQGSSNALNQLVDMFHNDIFRMLYYRLYSKADAEDLTQEVFMKVFKNLTKLKEADKFKSWLYTIALNCVRDFKRKKLWSIFQWTTHDDEDDTEPEIPDKKFNPEQQLAQQEFWCQFHQFTEDLARQEREIFTLRFLDHLGIREIAEVLKKNESTVKTHLYRAIKKFKNNNEFQHLLKEGI